MGQAMGQATGRQKPGGGRGRKRKSRENAFLPTLARER